MVSASRSEREEYLRELARVADFGAQEEVARDLLGDRAAAGDVLAAGGHERANRAEDAAEVDAAVAVEIGVLGREKACFSRSGTSSMRTGVALGLAESRNQLAVADIDLSGTCRRTSFSVSTEGRRGEISQ